MNIYYCIYLLCILWIWHRMKNISSFLSSLFLSQLVVFIKSNNLWIYLLNDNNIWKYMQVRIYSNWPIQLSHQVILYTWLNIYLIINQAFIYRTSTLTKILEIIIKLLSNIIMIILYRFFPTFNHNSVKNSKTNPTWYASDDIVEWWL